MELKKHTWGVRLCTPFCVTVEEKGVKKTEIVKTPLFLDVSNTLIQQTVTVKQYDTARELHITLTDGGRPYRIGRDCTAVFSALKPDGYVILNNCTVEDNTVVYAFTAQTTAACGVMPSEVRIYGADNALLTSHKFFLRVEKAVYGGDTEDKVVSGNEYNALTKLITQANTLVSRIFETETLTGNAGTDASVERIYDEGSNTVTYKFTVPRGDRGEKGDRGFSGVYVGSGDMPDGYNVQIDPEGEITPYVAPVAKSADMTQDVGADANGRLYTKPTDIESLKEIFADKTKTAALLFDNAGAHNAIYRGKNLGTSVTEAQWAAIANGTFADLYIGDYWVINGVNWRIAAFDYYFKTGDVYCTAHHAVIVPDTSLYDYAMNDSNTTAGGYVGSEMYTDGLVPAKTVINSVFGSSHILSHRQLLVNAVTDGKPSGSSWYDSTVELMTEQNVHGSRICGAGNEGSIDKAQFPLFSHDPSLICNSQYFWLRDVATSVSFAGVSDYGQANNPAASANYGVRPAFAVK